MRASWLGLAVTLFTGAIASAAPTTTVAPATAGPPAQDRRAVELREMDAVYAFTQPRDRAAWDARAAELRLHVLVSAGLWPLPARTPLRPSITGRLERDGYTVEKVSFESFPGFFVTGNL